MEVFCFTLEIALNEEDLNTLRLMERSLIFIAGRNYNRNTMLAKTIRIAPANVKGARGSPEKKQSELLPMLFANLDCPTSLPLKDNRVKQILWLRLWMAFSGKNPNSVRLPLICQELITPRRGLDLSMLNVKWVVA